MKHFTAQIIYRIICEGVLTEQYEEQWRLVVAEDERRALEMAKAIGSEEASIFVDRHGRRIEWQLIAVKDLSEVVVENGALLFSSVKEIQPIASPLWALAETH
ncbi:MAG: DUF4288 domain-containing protein [Sphingobacteriales bacterium]|nr:MAG: DUF4288 domain-containing protein [Sphingobacteriales bacterium]